MNIRYIASLASIVLMLLGAASCQKEVINGTTPESLVAEGSGEEIAFRALPAEFQRLRGDRMGSLPNGLSDLLARGNDTTLRFKAIAYNADGTNFFPTSDIKLDPDYLSGLRWGTEQAYKWPDNKIEVFAAIKAMETSLYDWNDPQLVETWLFLPPPYTNYETSLFKFDESDKSKNTIELVKPDFQTTHEDYNDIMVAHAIGDPEQHKAGGIPLKFEHILSEINVQVALSEGESGYPAQGLLMRYYKYAYIGGKFFSKDQEIFAPYYVNVAAVGLFDIKKFGTFTFNDKYLEDPEHQPIMNFEAVEVPVILDQSIKRSIIAYNRNDTEGPSVLQLTNQYQNVLGENDSYRFYIPPQTVTPWTGYKQHTEGKSQTEAPMDGGFYIGLLINFYTDTDKISAAGNTDYYLYPGFDVILNWKKRWIDAQPGGVEKIVGDQYHIPGSTYAWIAVPIPEDVKFESGKSYTFKINLLGNKPHRGLGYLAPIQPGRLSAAGNSNDFAAQRADPYTMDASYTNAIYHVNIKSLKNLFPTGVDDGVTNKFVNHIHYQMMIDETRLGPVVDYYIHDIRTSTPGDVGPIDSDGNNGVRLRGIPLIIDSGNPSTEMGPGLRSAPSKMTSEPILIKRDEETDHPVYEIIL